MKRILGIDYGDARTGISITDALNITAQGLETINNKNKKIQQVNAKLNIVVTTYYKGTGMEEVLKKLEQYLDSCDKNEHSITSI